MSGKFPSRVVNPALPGSSTRLNRPLTHVPRAGFWQEALANLQTTIDERVDASGLGEGLETLRDRALDTVDAARETCRREVDAFKREQEEHFGRLDAEAAADAANAADAAAAQRAAAAARAALDAMEALATEPPSPGMIDEPAEPPPPPSEPLYSPPTERLLARLAALNPLSDAQPPPSDSDGSAVLVEASDAGSSIVFVDAADAEDDSELGRLDRRVAARLAAR